MQFSPNNPRSRQSQSPDGTGDKLSYSRDRNGIENMSRSRRKPSSSGRKKKMWPDQESKYETAPFTENPGLTNVGKTSPSYAPSRSHSKLAKDLEPVLERSTEQSQIFNLRTHSDLDEENRCQEVNGFSPFRYPKNRHSNQTLERSGKMRNSQHMETTGRSDSETDQFARLGANFRSPEFQKDKLTDTKESTKFRDTGESGFAVRTEPGDHGILEAKGLKKENSQSNLNQSKLKECTFQADAYETGHFKKNFSDKSLSRKNSFDGERRSPNEDRRGSNSPNSFTRSVAESPRRDSYLHSSKSLDTSLQYRKSLKIYENEEQNPHNPESQQGKIKKREVYYNEAIQRILKSNDPVVLKCFIKKLLDAKGQSENIDPMRPALGEIQRSGNIVPNTVNRSKQDTEFDAFEIYQQALSQLKLENNRLRKELEEVSKKAEALENGNKDKIRALQSLTEENSQLQKRLVDHAMESEQAMGSLLQQVKRLEATNQNLLNDRNLLSKNLEESTLALKTLSHENENVKANNKRLKAQFAGHEKMDKGRKPAPESANISIIEFKSNDNSMILDDHSKNISREDYYKAKSKSLKERVTQLENEVINLRLELKTSPSYRLERKGSDVKVKHSKKESERIRSQSIDFGIPGNEASVYNSLANIRAELGVKTPEEIIPRIRELYNEIKTLSKFTDAIKDMAIKCAPVGFYASEPNLKQVWRFLKGMVQEHINLKKQHAIDKCFREVMEDLKEDLGLEDAGEIGPKVRFMAQENRLMDSVISKFKFLNDFNFNSLHDVDRALDSLLRKSAKGKNNLYRGS